MSRVSIKWYGEEFLARVSVAAEFALDFTADQLRSEVITTLRDTTGIAIGKTPTGRNIFSASLPGDPPGSRTGRLRNSIKWTKSGRLRRRVGTNLEYARIHELGGTINHPGGTDYIVTSGGAVFISEEKGLRLRQQGYWVGRTKPHAINMPKRPYLVPTLNRMAASGKLSKVFNNSFRVAMLTREQESGDAERG